jgi:hypothetical protein
MNHFVRTRNLHPKPGTVRLFSSRVMRPMAGKQTGRSALAVNEMHTWASSSSEGCLTKGTRNKHLHPSNMHNRVATRKEVDPVDPPAIVASAAVLRIPRVSLHVIAIQQDQ